MTPGMRNPNKQTVVRVEHTVQGTQGRTTHVIEIVRPSTDLMAHDPTMIAGFASLGRRVILQAFEDAALGDAQARAFLTEHEDDGLLAHWIQQADLALPLSTFVEGARIVLDDPERMQTLFARYRPHTVPVSSPFTPVTDQEESIHE